MLVVLSFCHRDSTLALQNAEWIASLEGSNEHKWIVACNQIAGATDMPQRIAEALRVKYAQVEVLVHYDADERRWPYAQNHAFQRAAQYVAGKYHEPWLWLECDAIPLKDAWLDALEAEYRRGGKHFMGMLVDVTTAQGQSIPQHLSGVSVYPAEVAQHTIAAMTCAGIAFDMAGAEEVLPKAHFTNLIFHKYQCPSISRDEEFNAWVPKEAVLLHQQKDDTIIRYLREKNQPGGAGASPAEFAGSRGVKKQSESPGSEMQKPAPTFDIFIKTFPRDYDWLEWCLKSIGKFANGFRHVIILSPEGGYGTDVPIRHITRTDQEPGYLWQQVCKLYSDNLSDADYILFMDSDCVLTRPVTPQTFMRDGKIMWGHKAYRDDERRAWQPVVSKWMNEPVERSFMTAHPFVFPRWLFEAMREYCRTMHKQELSDYIMAQHREGQMLTFSEFNCAGAFAYKYHRDKFCWVDRDVEVVEPCIYQGFTHGGEERKQQDLREFEHIICDTGLTVREALKAQEIKDPLFPIRKASVSELVGQLAILSRKDGFAKGRIVKQLRSAGILPAKKK